MTPDLKVYWRPGCSSCVKVKEYLTQQGVAFQSIDVSARPEAMKDLLAFGVKTVPVTSIAVPGLIRDTEPLVTMSARLSFVAG